MESPTVKKIQAPANGDHRLVEPLSDPIFETGNRAIALATGGAGIGAVLGGPPGAAIGAAVAGVVGATVPLIVHRRAHSHDESD